LNDIFFTARGERAPPKKRQHKAKTNFNHVITFLRGARGDTNRGIGQAVF
jgi:hypothetical protein